MSIRQVIMWIMIIFFGGLSATPGFSQNGVTLENQPWPVSEKCQTCVPVQFGQLKMHLPLSEIERILVTGSGSPILHIIPKTSSPKEGLHFISVSPDKMIGLYKKSGLLDGMKVKTNEQLFDLLGKLPEKNKSLATMRRLKDIDTARRYIKTSKGSVHAYWIQSPLPKGSQRVYFVIDGQETVYLLAGDVTQKFYEAILSNLRIVDIP